MKNSLTPSQRLKRFRNHVSASQRDFAKVLGVSPGALAMWENETREISGPVLVLLERLEQEFGLVEAITSEPSLDSDHLAQKFTEKVLANIGRSSVKNPEGQLIDVRSGVREIVENYLSSLSGTRQLQVSMIEKIFDKLACARGLPLKIVQLASFIDFGLTEKTKSLLVDLQNSVAPMTAKQLNETFMESFGKLPDEIFSEWESRPFATASIGQVHKAKLPSGETVAVKVQYPHIYRKMVLQTEVINQLSLLISLFRNDYSDMLKDFVRKLREECDYTIEASNQTAFYEAFKDDPQIKIPKLFPDFCTPQVLTSEFIEGRNFREFVACASQPEKDLAGGIIHRFANESTMLNGLMHTDTHPLNFLFLQNQVVFLDFGRVVRFASDDLERLKAFYGAIRSGNKEETIRQFKLSGYVRNWQGFDFDEFWKVIRLQMNYELSPEPTRFTKEYVRQIWRMANSFKQRSRLTMNAHYFWPVFTSAGMWSILAELEAMYNWHDNAKIGMPDLKN